MGVSWTPDEERRPALPRVEDLPAVPGGYDRGAVEAAFDAFYRHTAQLDATLAALESVEAFQKQASELRADIRALRAASWGPLPGRQTWAAGYAARASSSRGGFLDVAPRLAVEAAFIMLVAVGAALADLGTTTVVLVVVAAWLVVGLAEVLASLTRGEPGTPALRPRSPAAQPPSAAAATVAVQAAVRDPWEAAASPLEAELEPEFQPEPEPQPDPEAASAQEAAPAPARRRFWQRREASVEEPGAEPDLAEELRPASQPEAPDEETGEIPAGEARPVAPQRASLRRGRR